MFAIGIREVRNALDEKADEIQREFVNTSRELRDVGRQIMETRGPELEELKNTQSALREKQQQLADEVNEWREKARSVQRHQTEESLKAHLNQLLPNAEGRLRATIERSLVLLDATAEQFEELIAEENRSTEQTPAGRLLERARISYELRGSDPGERQRAAIEFSNRQGMALNDEIVAEIEASIDDPDPLVHDVAVLTTIQLHRFRAMRVADLDLAHASVKRLSTINHPSVIPVLIEILDNPRTGFISQGNESVETQNVRSRMVALLRLVKWHTNEAKHVIQRRIYDPEHEIVAAAKRALELFPDQWTGRLKKS